MESQSITSNFYEANVDALAVVMFKGEKPSSGTLKELDELSGGHMSAVVADEEFKGESGDLAMLRLDKKGKVKARTLLLVGAGDAADYKTADVSTAAGAAVRHLRKCNAKSVAFMPRCEADETTVVQNAVQGAVTSQFEIDKYKTKDKNSKEVSKFVVCIEGGNAANMKKGIARGNAIGDSMNFTRDLANEPPNILHPTEMAKRAQAMAKEVGLKCEVLDEAKMRKLGMNSLLSVSEGSEQPAKLIVLRYTPARSTAKKGELLALVGKGVTFDTGGISLKPGENMGAMKYDMTGAATVLGTMRAIALLKPSVPVIGIAGAVENMPDGRATRPSDIVKAMNGKTIEILNTDAEGRLVLADAVAYAEKLGATKIIDMATLTGAVIIALGDHNTGIMGNDQELVDQIRETGKEVGENYWQLPLGKEYSKGIRSDIADIKNIGPRMKAGTIMGAVFIQEFIDKAKWAHLDIAGTAWCDNSQAHQAKGPTAVAVRTLIGVIERSQ